MTTTQQPPGRLQYGDGHFTTLRVQAGQPCNWPAHRARLQEACARLAMPSPDWPTLEQAVAEKAQQQQQGGLKVLLWRGTAGRGYRPAKTATLCMHVTAFAEPEHYQQWRRAGITLEPSPIALGHNPLLAGLKHCNRLEQVLAADALSADEAAVCDFQGHLVSAVSGNLFWVKAGQLFTPSLQWCGVHGTLRAWILAHADVQRVNAGIEVLDDADEIFITNALLGVVSVARYRQRQFGETIMADELRRALPW